MRTAWIVLAGVLCVSLHCKGEVARAGGESATQPTRAAKDFVAQYIAENKRGYISRPCGFDMNRNGVIGEPADRLVGDGKTKDPDGDGVNEDILYVDANTGSDTTGDGSPAKPYKTIQHALDQCDGPTDGAEDIVAIYGTFQEALTLRQSGVAGHYTRDDFQFPNNPFMLIGWDKDNDGEYPPYDTDDVAVLNGNSALPLAIDNPSGTQRLEIAHLTIKDYGVAGSGGRGAMRLRGAGSDQRHLYVHDLELLRICKAMPTTGGYIIFNLFSGGATLHYFACINNLFDEFGSFGFRGAGHGAGNYRFQNLTMKMYGVPGDTSWRGAPSGWKLWDENNHVEILDCIIDGNPAAFGSEGGISGIGVCQGSQDWTIRNNELIDLKAGISLTPDAGARHYRGRPVTGIVIDRNIWRNTHKWRYTNSTQAVHLNSSKSPAPATAAVGTVTITNNFFSSTVPFMGILSRAGNASATPTGTVTIAGNTIYGPSDYGAIYLITGRAYPKEDFVVKNNIIANVGTNYRNISSSYAPANWVANGNVYDGRHPSFVWNGDNITSLADWQAATGQDADSRSGRPKFVNAANGDLHLDPEDTVAQGFGVDITSITKHDFDGQPRSASRPVAGADAPPVKRYPQHTKADWPQFRGPNQDGVSPEKGLLRSWPPGGPTVLWREPLGVGFGGPSVRDGKVYVLDRVGDAQDALRCLDLATGKELWRYAYDAPGALSHNGSRSTPTVGEKYVFTVGPFGHIHCIDLVSHEPVWSKHLLKDFGGKMPRWGVAQSPVLYRDAVIVAPLSKKAGVVALAQATGKEIWRSPPLGGLAYVSPRIANLGGVEQVLIISVTRTASGSTTGRPRGRPPARAGRASRAGGASATSRPARQLPAYARRVSNRVAGVAADDGRVLWTYDDWRCLNPIPNPMPIGDDRVFITGGYRAGSVMLKLRPAENRFTVEVLFKVPDYGAQIPNPLLHDGHLYMICNGNFQRDGLVCMDLEGNVRWKTDRSPNLDRGHTLIADGLMYNMDGAKGILRLIEPTPAGYKEISQVELLGGKEIWAPMALADGKLLIRDQRQMICLDVKRAPVQE